MNWRFLCSCGLIISISLSQVRCRYVAFPVACDSATMAGKWVLSPEDRRRLHLGAVIPTFQILPDRTFRATSLPPDTILPSNTPGTRAFYSADGTWKCDDGELWLTFEHVDHNSFRFEFNLYVTANGQMINLNITQAGEPLRFEKVRSP